MNLKKAKKRFIEIANKTGIHGENLKQEPNMQEREELWDITRVFLNRIYTLDEIDNLSEEELKEYNDLCYWSISALHWNDSLEKYTFDNGRHRRDTILLALCLYVRLDENYKLYEKIKENFVLPHAFGSILLWVFNDMTLVKTQDIYFNNYDIEFIKEADKQREAFFLKHGYYYRGDEELQQDKIEKIALEIHMILNRKGRKSLSQFLLQYITNDKGLLDVDGYSNVKYLTEKKGAKYNFNQSSEEKKGEYIKYESGISYQGEAKGEVGNRIPHGKGVMTVPDGPVITGDFKEGLADGYAKMDFLDGEVYEGEFKENKKHGKGIYVWPDGKKYEGEYQKGEEHGHGIYIWPNGNSWEGEYENGKKDGVGTYSYSDGAKFTSDWRDDEWSKVTMVDFDENNNEIQEVKNSKYTSSKGYVFYGKYNDDRQRNIDGTITTPDGVKINLKDCEKYKDKNLTDAYAAMKNTYGSHTFEYDDTDNGILSFERVSEIFGDCTNEEELSYEMDRVYGLKVNNHEGYVILHTDDNEIKKALEKERDIESNVIIKSDNMQFIEILVEILKLNNRDKDSDNANKDTLQFDVEFKEEETIEEKKKMKNNYVFEDWPVKLCLEKFDSAKIKLKDEFDKKYPELKDRFEVLNKELIFTISKESEIHEHNWSVDFLESNVNEGRPYNGLGRKLSKEIYTDLFQLFCDDGDVFFASSNDNCIVETVGELDSRCSFKLKNDGLHWEEEEEEEDWDDEEVKEEEKKEVNKEFWWDEINDYVIDKIKQEDESLDEYLGYLQILFIDEWDVEDEVEGAMRYHNKVAFDDVDKLEQWIGKEEVKKWRIDWEALSEEEKKNTHETALYISTDEGYEYLTHLTIDKENFIEQLEIEVTKKKPVKEVKKEASTEEVSPKEDVDNIQSFRNFMKEKFPSLKLPKNKSYAGIDLKDGYSINFHVQKKAVVLSFRSVKTDPEEIMRILNDKGLNGKDIGDGHVLKAEPGKRNPSIITMNIEIPYSSEEELASDELRENVRSYFENFSELFNFNK